MEYSPNEHEKPDPEYLLQITQLLNSSPNGHELISPISVEPQIHSNRSESEIMEQTPKIDSKLLNKILLKLLEGYDSTVEQPLYCQWTGCNFTFTNEEQLLQHVQNAHFLLH